MNFLIYKQNGEVYRTLSCNLRDLDLNVGQDELVWQGSGNVGDYIENGIVLTPSPSPSLHHIFNYDTKQWYDPRTTEQLWDEVRTKRDKLLSSCDWTQLPDVPVTAATPLWVVYRQNLRDITLQSDPKNITWPEVPNAN